MPHAWGGAFALSPIAPANLNNFVNFAPLDSTFRTTPDTADCPAGFVGRFTFNGQLTDKVDSPPLSDLIIQVATITNGNLLQNADGGPAGVGATLTVPKTGDFSDGVLSPGESIDVPFSICLKTTAQFQFLWTCSVRKQVTWPIRWLRDSSARREARASQGF